MFKCNLAPSCFSLYILIILLKSQTHFSRILSAADKHTTTCKITTAPHHHHHHRHYHHDRASDKHNHHHHFNHQSTGLTFLTDLTFLLGLHSHSLPSPFFQYLLIFQ